MEWNGHLEILSRSPVIENSRPYLLRVSEQIFYRKQSLGAPGKSSNKNIATKKKRKTSQFFTAWMTRNSCSIPSKPSLIPVSGLCGRFSVNGTIELEEKTDYRSRQTSKLVENNSAVLYVESSLTVHNSLFLFTNCD